jgi:hypothetical protein
MKTLILFIALLASPAFAQTVELPSCEAARVSEESRLQALAQLYVYGRDLQQRVIRLDIEWKDLQANLDADRVDGLTALSEFLRIYEEQEKLKAEFAEWTAVGECLKSLP